MSIKRNGSPGLALLAVLAASVGTTRADEPNAPNVDPAETADFDEGGFDEGGFDDGGFDDGLTGMDLEDLMQIEVTSVAGVATPLSQTPSAVYVITHEELRRTGHRTIADALRLAPGFHVSKIESQTWSVGARGQVGRFANKLLVLLDGRVVYDPLFSGTFWDVQDMLMEDVDRIEVIRGPGATLWGSNAVAAVVNVVSRSARETQGLYLMGGGGTAERAFSAFRYGGMMDERTAYRIWGKFDERENSTHIDGTDHNDDWQKLHGGVRFDVDADDGITLTFQAEVYSADRIGEEIRVPVVASVPTFTTAIGDGRASGGHLRFKAAKESEESGWSFQAYYDRTNRTIGDGFEALRDTVDINYRYHFVPAENHDLMLGTTYRATQDTSSASTNGSLSMSPADYRSTTVSGFFQDTMTLSEDKLFAMVGSKFEHNSESGFEIQPSGRIWWTPNETNTIWASVSRAVRVPSRINHHLRLVTLYGDSGLLAGGGPSGQIIPILLAGTEEVEAEDLLAFELGWRAQLSDSVSIDVAMYFNRYDDFTLIPSPGGLMNNSGDAEVYGVEISSTWDVADNVRLSGSYSGTQVQIHGPGPQNGELDAPHHQAQAHAFIDLTDDLELNAGLSYIDQVTDFSAGDYLRLDVGFTWRPTTNLELSIWGQNLLSPAHREATDSFFLPDASEVERSVYLQATLRF